MEDIYQCWVDPDGDLCLTLATRDAVTEKMMDPGSFPIFSVRASDFEEAIKKYEEILGYR